jgi:hypothetical protein
VPATVTDLNEAYDARLLHRLPSRGPDHVPATHPHSKWRGSQTSSSLGLGDFRNISTPPLAEPSLLRSTKPTAAITRLQRHRPVNATTGRHTCWDRHPNGHCGDVSAMMAMSALRIAAGFNLIPNAVPLYDNEPSIDDAFGHHGDLEPEDAIGLKDFS